MLNGKQGSVELKMVFIMFMVLFVPTIMVGGTVVERTFRTQKCRIKISKPESFPAYMEVVEDYDSTSSFKVAAEVAPEVTPTGEGYDCNGDVVWECIPLGTAACPSLEEAFPEGHISKSGQEMAFSPREPGKYKVKATFSKKPDGPKAEVESGEIVAVKLIFLRNDGTTEIDPEQDCLNISNLVTTEKMGNDGNEDPDNFKVQVKPAEAEGDVEILGYASSGEMLTYQGLIPDMDGQMISAYYLRLVSNQVDNDAMPAQTQMAETGGTIQIVFNASGGETFERDASVCKTKEDVVPNDQSSVKTVKLHVIIHNTFEYWDVVTQDVGYVVERNGLLVIEGASDQTFSFNDINNNHIHDVGEECEPFADVNHNGTRDILPVITQEKLQDYVDIVNKTWGQCCTIFSVESVDSINNPDLFKWKDFLHEGEPNDTFALFQYNDNKNDTVDIYFIQRYFSAQFGFVSGVSNFVVMPPQNPVATFNITIPVRDAKPFTLAHELLHTISNFPGHVNDKTNLLYVSTTPEDRVGATKHMTNDQCISARTKFPAVVQ